MTTKIFKIGGLIVAVIATVAIVGVAAFLGAAYATGAAAADSDPGGLQVRKYADAEVAQTQLEADGAQEWFDVSSPAAWIKGPTEWAPRYFYPHTVHNDGNGKCVELGFTYQRPKWNVHVNNTNSDPIVKIYAGGVWRETVLVPDFISGGCILGTLGEPVNPSDVLGADLANS